MRDVAKRAKRGGDGLHKVSDAQRRADRAQKLRAPAGKAGCDGIDYVSKCLGIHDVSKIMLDPI